MRGELFTRKLVQGSLRCANYWQSVLRFGLPWVILYRGMDYAGFRITTGNTGLPYPWRVAAITDIPVMFLVSTLWWALMREIAAWQRKNQQAGGAGGPDMSR